MSIANPTIDYLAGERPSAPLIALVVSFDGDSNYPTGGTANFKTTLRTALAAVTPDPIKIGVNNIVSVLPVDTKGYQVAYNRADDKLIIRQCAASGNPMAEVSNASDLHLTRFSVMVVLK